MTLILENIIQIKKIYRHRSPTSAIISDVKKAKQRKAIHQMTSYDEADEHPPLPIKKPTSITTVENKNDNQLDANDTDHEGRFLELTNQRTVYNHTFGGESTINNKINHIQWTVDCIPSSINSTLTQFQYVNSLELYYDIKEIIPNPCSWHIILPALRYVELNFDWNIIRIKNFIDRSVTPIYSRFFILDQIRRCAPLLQCLTLWWHDLRPFLTYSHLPWPSIQQLNIRLRRQDNPPASLIKRLPTNQAFPQLQYLTFGSRRFMLTPPELVAKQILSWLDALLFPTSKLVILHLNRRCSFFLTRPPTARDVFRMLLDQHVQSMNHHSPAKIIIDSNEEVIIWL
ncbi:unnamed protein product [Rotaria sordida]|uniref:Uncharacterized protein n=1 Tax=Rotaria sordida TaxID=392033 RepID=A0A815CZJ1_9BILA|nr:unnamed protein product [Rotaria sordida]CAF3788292.1 unnamed protein product [Rotaria sordida]